MESNKEIFKEFLLDFPLRLSKFEQTALSAGLDMRISISEIHIISRIGPEGSQKMNTIARKLGVTQATLTVACDKLETKGLIERHRDTADRRAVTVTLTAAGLVAYSFHTALMDNLAETFLANLTQDEMNKLIKSLGSVYEQLSFE